MNPKGDEAKPRNLQMKKKVLSLLVILSAAVAFADGMVLSKPVQISSHYEQLDMRNILKMPVWEKLDIDLGDTSKACCLHNRGDGIRGELVMPPKTK